MTHLCRAAYKNGANEGALTCPSNANAIASGVACSIKRSQKALAADYHQAKRCCGEANPGHQPLRMVIGISRDFLTCNFYNRASSDFDLNQRRAQSRRNKVKPSVQEACGGEAGCPCIDRPELQGNAGGCDMSVCRAITYDSWAMNSTAHRGAAGAD